jgi:hypothetical protein
VREWFDGWIAWEKRHKADRHLVVGIGGYLSAPAGVLAQIDRARMAADGRRADGVSLYSYFRPFALPQTPDAERPENVPPPPDRFGFLRSGAGESTAPFTSPAPVPSMPWIQNPTRAFIAGTAVGNGGSALDGVSVAVRRRGLFRRTRRTATDGNGWFGMTQLKPGKYRVTLERPGEKAETETIRILAGGVGRADLVVSRPRR